MAIRFINTKAVSAELARDEIDEKGAFQYFLANTLLWTVSLYYALVFGANISWMFLLELVVVLLITIHGLLKAFGVNGGAGGRSFVVRATCLSFPIGLKVNIVSLVMGLVAAYLIYPYVIDPNSFRSPERVYELIMFLWAPAFTAIFFWRLSVHLKEINK